MKPNKQRTGFTSMSFPIVGNPNKWKQVTIHPQTHSHGAFPLQKERLWVEEENRDPAVAALLSAKASGSGE
jgi:hypothetical protein